VGEDIGLKTSTAFVPPELAVALFRPTETLSALEAEETRLEAERALKKKQRPKDRVELKKIEAKLKGVSDKIAILEDGDGGQGKLKASTQFDVWGFGAVMYEMLCGR
jgi:type IV secretory pathway VirJ component